MTPFHRTAQSPALAPLADALAEGRRVVATGTAGSSVAFTAGALASRLARPVVLVLAHLDEADEAADELQPHVPVIVFPAIETLPGEPHAVLDTLTQRVTAAAACPSLAGPAVIACPIQALMQSVPSPRRAEQWSKTLTPGLTLRPADLARWLTESGYSRVEAVEEPGQFAQRGGILDVFSPGASGAPVRLDFFGDEIDRLSEFDPQSMAADRRLDKAELVAADPARFAADDTGVSLLDLIPAEAVVLIAETMEVVEQGRGYYERVLDAKGLFGPPAVLAKLESRFAALAELNQFSAGASAADTRLDLGASPLPSFPRDAADAVAELRELARTAHVLLCCQNEGEASRAKELLAEHSVTGVAVTTAYVHRGFLLRDDQPAAIVPYHELLNRFGVRRRATRLRAARAMDTFLDLDAGDYVVHADEGIARYAGLQLMKPRELPSAQLRPEPDATEECLVLEFANKARLFVPAVQIDKVQKYVGGFQGKPPLSVLGGSKWRTQKARVSESVKDLAAELMRVRAAREHLPGIAFPGDTTWQREFEAEFPYDETEDQLAGLAEIKRDMGRPRPMDRLLCGDVGFGKTELAIRAAFKAAEFGKQVAILVPTTVLAEQHERTFRSRFAGYPFRIESISRFKSDAQVRATLDLLRKGQVDVIIGTHRLLSQDVHFADLGLVVIDEEQRFGVEHKEALLRLRLTVDVLTLSATPIPRTLHMAMLGIRDISSLTTAPLDRRAIVTEVIPFNAIRVRQAIERELAREGQVFYVHNRVHDILSKADDIRRLVPNARIVVGHGQMAPHELEDVMLAFIRRDADILVATTIIESGIDIPTANTMIIDDADRFGLADLHQLRGRVGRGKHRGYCYLLLPDDRAVKEVAQKRLKAIEQYSMLGAGFKIAMRDLEIRGAGNILGAEQSGHIALVGYEMYCRLLEQAVGALGSEKPLEPVSATAVEIGVSGHFPKTYIPSESRRLDAYRRLAAAATPDQLDTARKDLIGAYGDLPAPAARLFDLAALRIAAAALSVRTLTVRDRDVLLLCEDGPKVQAALSSRPGTDGVTVRALPPKSGERLAEVYIRPPAAYFDGPTLLTVLSHRLGLRKPPPPAPKPTRPPAPKPSRRPGR